MEGREGKGKKTWYDEKTGRVVLLIEDLGPGDEGDYQCRADNPYGDSTCTITVSIIFIFYTIIIIIYISVDSDLFRSALRL